MRHFVLIMIFAMSLITSPIYAGQDEYDDCLLKHLINAKVDSASQIMKRACEENYKFTVLPENKRKVNQCFLEYLPGVESGDAAIEIQKVCERKHL